MASDSDCSDVEEYSGMEQPPLIKQLTTILAEYPDDGQIIKELVQNAEDAGATMMKIMYDGRQIDPPAKEKRLDKFFKGPALCFYNNAEFGDQDWQGIRMIYSSVKEEDPLKVGRFGLGFKSVFHITDYPVILSGDKVMMMNPCERNPGMVCVSIKLRKLRESKQLTTIHFTDTMDDTFGFTADTLTNGRYPGTIFRFPLRQIKSKLSDTIYGEDHIVDLLNSFQSDADSMLLFLKNLQEVQAFVHKTVISGSSHSIDRYNYGSVEPFFSVGLDGNVDEVVEKRKIFTTKLRNVHARGVADTSITSSAVVTYTTKSRQKGKSDVERNSSRWLVVNYLKGGDMSDRLRTLIQDTTLSYMPCVGVAAPLSRSSNFKGHIFCFLPLPHEQHSLTGLPVHVNGFFALSQNRRHLKWPSADQIQYGMHKDKSIDWNLELIKSVLPSAYLRLLQKAAVVGVTPEMVYRCIPNVQGVNVHWRTLQDELIRKAAKEELLYTENNGGSWLCYKHALFIDVQDDKYVGKDKMDSVKTFLRLDGKNLVDAPEHVICALKTVVTPTIVSSPVLSGLLMKTNSYQRMSTVEKYHILEYLLHDGKVENVDGLQLLQLQDGQWVPFSNMSTKYLASHKEVKLFPGLEAEFVNVNIPSVIHKYFQKMLQHGHYGLKSLQLPSTVAMLAESISKKFGTTTPVKIRSNHTRKYAVWVKDVWEYISSHHQRDVDKFENLPIFPVVSTVSWMTMQEFSLHKLTDLMIMKTSRPSRGGRATSLPEVIGNVLNKLSVITVPSVPQWLPSDVIRQFVPDPSPDNVIQILGLLHVENVDLFNRNMSREGRTEFVKYVYMCRIPTAAQTILRRLQIFEQTSECNGQKQWTTLDDNNNVLCQNYFPVRYPSKYIVASTEGKQLATSLGASTVDPLNIAKEVLKSIQDQKCRRYTATEVNTFMKWLLEQEYLEFDQTIKRLAQSTQFVKSSDGMFYCPHELYDPTDTSLKSLFHGEHRFPADNSYSKGKLFQALQRLGLKCKSDISAQDVHQTAQVLDKLVCTGCSNTYTLCKAETLWMLLEEKPRLLEGARNIGNLCCIPRKTERHPNFPESVQWYATPYSLCKPAELKSYSEHSVLIGSVIPVADSKRWKNAAKQFGWNDPPAVSEIVRNLLNIVEQYQSARKDQFVFATVAIYKHISLRSIEDVTHQLKMVFKNTCNSYVWFGDGFLAPDAIYTDIDTSDIDLRPYLFPLPVEVSEFKFLFKSLDCHQHQSPDVLKKVLEKINQYNESNAAVQTVRKDLVLVVNVLNRLRDISETQNIKISDVLFPVHSGTATKLSMKMSRLCTYCDTQWLKDVDSTYDDDDDDGIVYVHGDVPTSTAEQLGVKSLKQQIMSDTEGLEEWGQTEPLTRRLHNVLKEGYVDGFSIPKELVQNADDAGAQEIRFLYDERENLDARTCLIDEGMADSQGPAIWVYNDAEFTDEDFNNITKFSGGTKEGNAAKIGKFGLGFSSVYNLTDVPSFVSRSNVVIFDPHMTNLGKAVQNKSPGLKIDLQKMKNMNMMKKLNNQFKPFQGIFGCDLTSRQPYFSGTLFRFPLRTYAQSKTSEICSIAYSKEECQKLLKLFIESAGNLLLFNQNVKVVRLYHIPASGVDPSNPTLIFEIKKTELPIRNVLSEHNSILSTVASCREHRLLKDTPCQELTRVQIIVKVEEQKLIEGVSQSCSQVQWLVSWASGVEEKSLDMSYANKGAIPLGSVAMPVKCVHNCLMPLELTSVPIGFYKNGHLFCFMPLPITTGLPFHINGSFAVSSDRRQLRHETEDDKGVPLQNWNESLFTDAICRSFMYLLSRMKHVDMSDEYCFHQLWPQHCTGLLKPFEDSFYINAIALSSEIFERGRVWLEFSSCKFLDQTLREDEESWNAAFEVCTRFEKTATLIDIPSVIYNRLKEADSDTVSSRTVTKEWFFVEIFTPNLDSKFFYADCQKRKRDKLILYALMMKNDVIDESLKIVECIPTLPLGVLQKPSFLLHNAGKVTSLFSIDDGRFAGTLFENSHVQGRLVELGMMKDAISGELIVDRARSIQRLASSCANCAVQRCSNLMKYLQHIHRDVDVKQICPSLGTIPFLPAMEKPDDWPLRWHAETLDCLNSIPDCKNERCLQKHRKCLPLRLASAKDMFDDDCVHLVSTLGLVLDRKRISIHVELYSYSDKYLGMLKHVGIRSKDDVPIESVMKQLRHISCDFSELEMKHVPQHVGRVCNSLYLHLNEMCRSPGASEIVSQLKNEAIISLADSFVNPYITAGNLRTDCSPYLYTIKGHVISGCTDLCSSLQIASVFNAVKICQILVQLKKTYGDTCLPEQEIELTCNIIKELTYAMKQETMQLDKLYYQCGGVFAPDNNGVLTLTTTMCFNDCVDIESSDSMVYIHDKVSAHDAKLLGVKTKRNQNLQDTSEEIGFFQNEPLVTRLRGLLYGYPCDTGIFKELLQNADDAKATELHFIKDYRQHEPESGFDESLQGPALCVYNNSSFTTEDLKGIQNLGTGSKREDPSKTGEFGVGFNAVYNLTDVPSFLTKGTAVEGGETMCMFDPFGKSVPNTSREKPGRRFVNLKNLKRNHAAIFKGYHENVFENEYGTMFRFPLRRTESEISNHCWTEEKVDTMFAEYCEELQEALIFLKHVRKVTISNITSGELLAEYSVQATLERNGVTERQRYYEHHKHFADIFKVDRMSVFDLACKEFRYEIDIVDCHSKHKWFVVQRVGYPAGKRPPEVVKQKYLSGELGLLPQGGVAICLDENKNRKPATDHKYKAFCVLPLPLHTGLPVHVNGHFSLDPEARRSLWRGEHTENCHKTQWNKSLLELVVAPCYVTVLNHVKDRLFNTFGDKLHPVETVIDRLQEFKEYLPCTTSVSVRDDYWEQLTHNVFQQIVEGNIQLFPCLHKENRYEKQHMCILTYCKIDWMSLNVEGFRFPAYFCNYDISVPLLSTLQRLGLRLISNSEHMHKSVNEAKREALKLSPDVVIKFLKSFNSSDEDRCKLVVDVPVDQTVMPDIDMAYEILKFCSQSKTFSDQLEQLPLLVNNCGMVKQFSAHNPVYVTRYCDLFPDDGHQFLNRHLVGIIMTIKTPFSYGMFQEFQRTDFVNCLNHHSLAETLNSASSQIDFDPKQKTWPNAYWIQNIWDFLYDESKRVIPDYSKLKKNKQNAGILKQLEKNVAFLGQWALVPIAHCNCLTKYSLIGANRLHMILDIGSFRCQTPTRLCEAVMSLNLPSLVTDCFNEYKCPKSLQILRQLTATADNPVRVLTCLVANLDQVCNLPARHCAHILRYFADNIEKMKHSAEEWWVKQNLRKLPLFLTKDDVAVALTDGSVIVITDEMPSAGVADWANKTKTIVLQEYPEIKTLYQYLGCEYYEVIDVYLHHILRSPHHMNNSDILQHVDYMRNRLFTVRFGEEISEKQNHLLMALRHLPFVTNSCGTHMKASDLKNPNHKVFKQFCSDSDFPAVELQREDWLWFLLKLGLQNDVTGELYLQFADQIQSEGGSNITDDVEEMSKALVTHLFNESPDTLDSGILQQLSTVNFVVPFHVAKLYSQLHPQMAAATQMISFADSVIHPASHVCWTAATILPVWAVPPLTHDKWFDQYLKCRRDPTSDMIILHCQNIGYSLKQKLPTFLKNMISTVWVNELMEKIYKYFQSDCVSVDDMEQRLYNVPLVYYPEGGGIYPAFHVVKDCSDSEEVIPYLMKAPSFYGKYFNVFMKLGSSEKPQCYHYAQVLKLVKEKCGSKELNPDELLSVAEAVTNLLQCLRSSEASDIDVRVDQLYLPTRHHCLEKSPLVTVSNNVFIEKRIMRGSSLTYLIDLVDLDNILKRFRGRTINSTTETGVFSGSTVMLFKKLNGKYQPKILSELVKEELDNACLSPSITSFSANLESFLHNPDFIQGILRLVQQTMVDSKNELSATEDAEINTCFQNTKVMQASGMNTHILLENASGWEYVQGSECPRVFHYTQERVNNVDHYKLYIDADGETRAIPRKIERCLVNFINDIAKGRLVSHQLLVANIFRTIDQPDTISMDLDEYDIVQYGLRSHCSNELIPKPGKYVPRKYHAFLDNEFGVFEYHDRCVAYEQEDPCIETEESNGAPTYIYAAIILKVNGNGDQAPLFQLYQINIGETEYITVPGYKLYRFLRKPNTVREVVLAGSVPEPSHSTDNAPLQHTYREIRTNLSQAWTRSEIEMERKHIIKRLLLKWHPDKNPENEKYCTKVFQYIQQCICKLEQGVALEDSEDETDGFNRGSQNTTNFTSSRYNTFFTNMNQRSSQHQRYYEAEAQRGSSNYGSGNYFYHSPEPEPYHYHEEAERWQRQAKSDCQDARLALRRIASPAYNWVCYRCHQAAEKSLKAAWFAKDANKMIGDKKHSHTLCYIAQGLDSELRTLADRMSTLTRGDTSMRYPDRHAIPVIPATAYDRQCAEEVCGIAEEILTLVSDTYGC